MRQKIRNIAILCYIYININGNEVDMNKGKIFIMCIIVSLIIIGSYFWFKYGAPTMHPLEQLM